MTNAVTLSNLLAWSGQSALLIGAALLAIRAARLEAPAVRYLFLRVVLAAALLLPLIQPRLPVATVTAAPSSEATVATAGPADSGAPAGAPARPQIWMSWTPLLLTALAAGAAVRLIWIGVGIVRLRRLRRLGEILPAGADHDELQSMIGTKATVRYVAGLGQPVTFGFMRPIVLLPQRLREKPAAIHRAVLAHELWHVRRRDWMWTVVEEATRACFWFHPAVWMLLSRIQATREEVVDELAILATGSRRSYVDALLAFADESPIFAATAFARRRHLVRRMVLISKEAVMSARRVVGSGVLVALATVSTGWYAVQAFPLTERSVSQSIPSDQVGPVEMRAKPITPENPIPRRTFSVPADYPDEAAAIGARGKVTVRLTIDESGRVVETRVASFSLTLPDASVGLTGGGTEGLDRLLNGAFRGVTDDRRQAVRAAFEAMADSATRAASRWLYAPPEDGPLAFSVDVQLGPQGSTAPPPPPPAPPARTASWQVGGSQGAIGASDPNRVTMTGDAVRVGGAIKAPTKLVNAFPVYPPIAQSARVQGVVILETRIEPDGGVSDVRVLRSIPLLDEAAVAAVRQWRFTPTLLNGEPVAVIMTTTVNFTLE
jgi:TonB family protein